MRLNGRAAMTQAHAGPVETPAERVRLRLLRAVLEQRLPPGAKLTEEEIAAACGATRGAVRAALVALAHEGLVTQERHRGAFVASPGAVEAREVFEARLLLEPPTARAAAARVAPADMKTLSAHLTAEAAAMASGDLGRAVHLSGAFHVAIAELAGQTVVSDLIRGLAARSALIVALYWRRRDSICESCAHEALLAALGDRDGARAEGVMRAHLADLLSALDLSPQRARRPDLAAALNATP
jgi:DNA-binding GntR family transcriptional regulator